MATHVVTENRAYSDARQRTLQRSRLPEPLYADPLDEHHFVRMLRLERKRCERSGDVFMLMLLESPALFQGTSGALIVEEIARCISSSSRETDVFGWYEQGTTLALIVGQIGPATCSNATVVSSRVVSALQDRLSPEMFDAIRVRVRLFPDDSDDELGKGNEFTFYREFSGRHDGRRGAHRIKRMIDVVVSVLALVALLPLMLSVALLVKCTSRGSVLFKQRRVGRYGTTFTFLKFRSMYSNNDPRIHQEYVARLIAGDVKAKQSDVAKQSPYKLVDDPRITPLGRLLRKSSLDELPQLFNVLRGEMSLVGPRPPLPYEFERYDTWHKRRVFEVKPGLTGLWQVKGRSKTTFDEMVRLDLRYAKAWSIGLDLEIMLQTPRAILSGDGAY